jgi:two-component system, response regulator PdtaR
MDRLQWVSQTPYRVVIAEDEALIRLDLKEMLEEPSENAYAVVGEASDGEAAVKLAAELRPDLVIMDVKMPVLDGISAAEQITARRLAPVVILTAFSQRDLVQRASSAGAMAYLVKPFTRAELIPAIEIAVSRFAEVSALQAEVGDLRERLEMRKLLDRAKGVLQASRGISEPEAFRWIQKTSMDRRMTMRALAQEILAEHQNAAKPASGSGTAAGPARRDVPPEPRAEPARGDNPTEPPAGPGAEAGNSATNPESPTSHADHSITKDAENGPGSGPTKE